MTTMGALICRICPQHDCPATAVVSMVMCGLVPPKAGAIWGDTAGSGQCCPPSREWLEPFWRGLLGQAYWAGLVLKECLGKEHDVSKVDRE